MDKILLAIGVGIVALTAYRRIRGLSGRIKDGFREGKDDATGET